MPPRFSPYELAFLSAIHAEPRDDAPRLTYADWLDENGRPKYAEFIRLQCQAARHTDAWSVRQYSEREEWLIGKYGDKWRGHALLAHGRVSKYGTLYFTRFHRGLPDADCYLSNHSSCIERQQQTMEILPPHYQVNVVLNIYDWRLWRGSQDPFPLLALPIFSRAQRIYIRAVGGTEPHLPEQDLPVEEILEHEMVRFFIEDFRQSKLLSIRFGPVTDESKALIEAELSPHVPTLTPCR